MKKQTYALTQKEWMVVWWRMQPNLKLDESGCLVWTAAKQENGYGMVGVGKGRITRAHRAAWLARVGPIPEHMVLDHLCHNRACCNLSHIRLSTVSENNSNLLGPRGNSRTGRLNIVQTPIGFRVIMKWNDQRIQHRTKTLEEAVAWRDAKRAEMGRPKLQNGR